MGPNSSTTLLSLSVGTYFATFVKTLVDEYGIINTAIKVLPDNLKSNFLEALAELEDNQCHQKRSFPKTRVNVIRGIKAKKFSIYRADIDKISGWRLHIQYLNGQIHLKLRSCTYFLNL